MHSAFTLVAILIATLTPDLPVGISHAQRSSCEFWPFMYVSFIEGLVRHSIIRAKHRTRVHPVPILPSCRGRGSFKLDRTNGAMAKRLDNIV